MRKLGRITRSKSYKIHVSLCEGWIVTVVCNSAYSGGFEYYSSYLLSEVLRYDASTGTWVKTGDLETGRSSHGVSTVDWDDIAAFCD